MRKNRRLKERLRPQRNGHAAAADAIARKAKSPAEKFQAMSFLRIEQPMKSVDRIANQNIGSNLGDARAQVERAIQSLNALQNTRLSACFDLFLSAPIDAQGGGGV